MLDERKAVMINITASAKYPPFENREGWGSLIRVGQPDLPSSGHRR